MSNEEKAEDSPTATAARGAGIWWKAAVVVGLAVAVAGVVALKAARGGAEEAGATDVRGPDGGQERPTGANPLDDALATGRPVVAEFGRGVCIPCKLMKPILEDLQKAYAGRAEIVVVDMDRYPAVTERVGIDAMPTQVFYDSRGVEIDRHQGFMPREDIVAKLAEMGAE